MVAAERELTEDDLHHVFSVECRGDTLIIAPRGDAAGFPERHFRDAVRALHDRFAKCRSQNLVIDLTATDYPGLGMLAAFRDLVDDVRRRGGVAAVAGPSAETDRVLEEFGARLDWTVYSDLAAATRAVVHEPIRGRFRRRRRAAAYGAAVLSVPLLVWAASASVREPGDASAYRDLNRVWQRYRQAETLPSDEPERQRVRDDAVAYANFIAGDLKARGFASAADTARRLESIVRSPHQPDPRAEAFEKDLAAKLEAIGGGTRPRPVLRARPPIELDE